MKLAKTAYTLIIIIASIFILIEGQNLIIPFILALIIWFIIKEVRAVLKKIKFFKEKLPHWLLSILASILIFVVLGVVINMLTISIRQLSEALPEYEANVSRILWSLNSHLGIDFASSLDGFYENFDLTEILKGLIRSLTGIFGDTFMILLYTLFLFLEEFAFIKKLKVIYPDDDKFRQANTLLIKIDKSIGSYLVLKSLVSILTGFLSYITLLIIGVEAALFWAFLIFMLNYIPTIGSLIATIFPASFALMQFGNLVPFFAVLAAVGLIQVIIGNIVEPKVMGNSLNISSLVVILTLSFWGAIWGITGMILSVPITVIIIIICAEFPKTRFIAIMLSEKGIVGETNTR